MKLRIKLITIVKKYSQAKNYRKIKRSCSVLSLEILIKFYDTVYSKIIRKNYLKYLT